MQTKIITYFKKVRNVIKKIEKLRNRIHFRKNPPCSKSLAERKYMLVF